MKYLYSDNDNKVDIAIFGNRFYFKNERIF